MSGKQSDESYCTSCGEIIKADAEICPECGVRQTSSESQNSGGGNLSDMRQYDLEKVANKNTTTAVLLSLLITPLGYYYVGKTGLAILNFITFNFFLLGLVIVPIHTYMIINNAEDELRRAGVEGY